MKKSLLLVASIALAFSFVACSNSAGDSTAGDSQSIGGNTIKPAAGVLYPVDSKSSTIASGSFILKNGGVVAASDITDAQKSDVIGVIFYKNEETKTVMAIGTAIKENVKWSEGGALEGYDAQDNSLHETWKDRLSEAGENSIAIDSDLFPVWEEFGKAWAASVNQESDWGVLGKYPAFDYAKGYGAENGITGEYADGWILPTSLCLKEIAAQKDAINTSLQDLGKTTLEGKTYWSSVTSYGKPGRWYARVLGGLANITDIQKNTTQSVVVVRSFKY